MTENSAHSFTEGSDEYKVHRFLYEHTFKITVYDLGIEIRCWVQSNETDERESTHFVKEVLQSVKEHKDALISSALPVAALRRSMATFIMKEIEEMNAIEIVDIVSRHGCVIYRDWP